MEDKEMREAEQVFLKVTAYLDAMDRRFLEMVRLFQSQGMGYGAMMQIIFYEYYRRATEENLCPVSGVLVSTCMGLLDEETQEHHRKEYEMLKSKFVRE